MSYIYSKPSGATIDWLGLGDFWGRRRLWESSFLRRLRDEPPPGDFGLIGKLELIVMNKPSQHEHRIALPAKAWNIMASKFVEVAYGRKDSPFDFNDCGYLAPPLKRDLGVEMVAIALHPITQCSPDRQQAA